MKLSNEKELIYEDIKQWTKNVLVFSASSIIVFLGVLQGGGTLQQAAVALYGALINALIDLFRKWEGETKYKGDGEITKVSDIINN